tara:strand:- start:124 stop:348 length:225 start_codon:yes stop_codon:yes gene_type:complete
MIDYISITNLARKVIANFSSKVANNKYQEQNIKCLLKLGQCLLFIPGISNHQHDQNFAGLHFDEVTTLRFIGEN